jgi:peptidoglycan hydrolase-like protein with peptidoglycan-binding domain
MDNLAYTHLVLAWENPSQLTLQLCFQFPKLSNKALLALVPLVFSACWLGTAKPSWALLQPGDTGSNVVQLQDRLAAQGYFNARSTGYYGPITETAVRQFQADRGLPVDGVVGDTTEAALNFNTDNRTSSPASTPANTTSTSEILRVGSQGQAVRNLQNRLRELGYFNATATGYYGDLTRNAVREFQADNGLAIDGIFGPRTQRAINSGTSASPAASFSSPSPSGTSASPAASFSSPSPSSGVADKPLRKGARGEKVVRLQNQLRQLGYLDAPATGYYGRLTVDAVQRFQADRGMSPDGMVGMQTQNILQQNAPSPSPSTNSNLLQRGSTGEAVTELQKQLQQLGFFQANATGFYGPLTETAVRRFQRDRNLNVDGIAGSSTQAAIDRALSPNKTAPFRTSDRLLQRGDTGEAVTELQNQLQQLGFFQANATGFYGPLTETAVRRFQRDRNLTVDGIAGSSTQAAIDRALSPNTTTAYSNNTRLLQRGDTGEAVTALQNQLQQLGFFQANATGYYGPLTEAAVRRFQAARNLSVDGVAGPSTKAALNGLEPTTVLARN